MARLPRLNLPGLPHYVMQHGNNRQPIFVDTHDRLAMLALLREKSRDCGLHVHAYVLLPNQFHLLLTPEMNDSLPRMMQALGRNYVRAFNNRHARSGTLWEGRYRSTVLEPARWLLSAMVALEQLPVQDGLVVLPQEFAWSSAAHNTGSANVQGPQQAIVHPHALYWALADTPFAREAAYARLSRDGVSLQMAQMLQQAALSGWALGSAHFVAELQRITDRRVARQRPGRPPVCTKIDQTT